jgi:hypothetical protein
MAYENFFTRRRALCRYLPAVAGRARRGRYAAGQREVGADRLAMTVPVLTGENV